MKTEGPIPKETREELRGEEHYRLLFEAESDAIFLIDNESGQILQANTAAGVLYGYPPDEMLCKKNVDLSAETEKTEHVTTKTPSAPDQVVTIPLRWHRKKDGTVFPVEITGRFFVRDGRPVHIAAIRDITQRLRSETALRESEERLRLALGAANQGLYDLNVQTGETIVSEGYARMLDYDPAEFHETNAAWIERLHPEDLGRVSAAYTEYVAGRLPEYRVEFRQRTRSGMWKWILSLGKIMERDEQGRPLRMLGTHTDITERKLAEEALRKGEERFRLTFQTSPDSININRLSDGMFVDINEGFTRLTGYTREEVIGKTSLDISLWHDPAEREELVRGLKEKGYYSGLEARFRLKDGTVGIGLMSARILSLGDIPHIISITRDITERKRMEQERDKLSEQLLQSQKMEAVGRLAGGVAHDFNNMLQTILGYSDLALAKIGPDDKLCDDLLEIKKAAERSAELTRQLLAFARKQTVSPQLLDLNDVVGGMLKMLRRLIGEDIELIWKPGPELWMVKVDPTQVDQILANLSVNARDAISGVGTLTIETDNMVLDETYCENKAGFLPGRYVMLAVSDNGCGMDKEVIGHLFEPFFTTKEVGKGTGLGLATVYGIVKQNSGFINVYSEPGRGTTFKVYLPRVEAVSEIKTATVEQKPVTGSETVLLVEDDNAILRLGTIILERYGYSVLTAQDPHEALALAQQHDGPIHLLVTDVVIPGMNGKDLKAKVSAIRSGIKILYMSGYTANVIAHHGVLDEGIHFLQKPFSVHTLLTKVRETLDQKD
jgi:PAS domain S-box-containing protein